jgi:DNA ligase (NAD+)
LTDKFPSIDLLTQATTAQMEGIYGVGFETAQSVSSWFKQPVNMELVGRLKAAGLQFEQERLELDGDAIPGIFADKTFVVTGTLPTLKRDDAKDLIQQHGGKMSDSISAKTDYLVAGEKAGSKLGKAEKFGVKIISEAELMAMIQGV